MYTGLAGTNEGKLEEVIRYRLCDEIDKGGSRVKIY